MHLYCKLSFDIPFELFVKTSDVETFATEMSTISLISKTILWSGAEPRYGLATSLTPLVRDCSCCEGRWTILRTKDESFGSRVEEEKTPENLSPFFVMTVVTSP